MSDLRFFVVDAFSLGPFTGNPAAVMPLERWPDDGWLQNVAMEMNLSETAYTVPNADGFDLRWFTPEAEVDLCGHATLATARVLAELGLVERDSEVRFATRSGTLLARVVGERVELDFPLTPQVPAAPPPGLLEALGARPRYVGKSRFDYLVELKDEQAVRDLDPDFRALARLDCRGVMVTARASTAGYDFVSRFFGPSVGIDEDPVTGSAHCCLADHWQKELKQTRFTALQTSRRGGHVEVEVRENRVILGGAAVIASQGEWLILPGS